MFNDDFLHFIYIFIFYPIERKLTARKSIFKIVRQQINECNKMSNSIEIILMNLFMYFPPFRIIDRSESGFALYKTTASGNK